MLVAAVLNAILKSIEPLQSYITVKVQLSDPSASPRRQQRCLISILPGTVHATVQPEETQAWFIK